MTGYHTLVYSFFIQSICSGEHIKSSYIVRKQKQPPEVFYKKGVLRNFAKFT